jgi:hypothetical protein
MHNANLDVPGNIALAFEIIVWLLYMVGLDGFDNGVDEVSKCTVPSHFVRKAYRTLLYKKKIFSCQYLFGNFLFSQNHCSSWSKLLLLRIKKVILGILSGAAKATVPVKLDNFRVASSHHGHQLQRTHYLLTGCQWSLVCWFSNLLTSNIPR